MGAESGSLHQLLLRLRRLLILLLKGLQCCDRCVDHCVRDEFHAGAGDIYNRFVTFLVPQKLESAAPRNYLFQLLHQEGVGDHHGLLTLQNGDHVCAFGR